MSQQMDIRDLELNALLEITQAINNNLSEKDLYRIYKFTLLADLKVTRLVMYGADEEGFSCKVNFGTEKDFENTELPSEYLSLEQPLAINAESDYEAFDLVFPVTHKKKLLAVVFIGGIQEDGYEKVDTTFIRALTNILIVAIENKKLARKQLQQQAYQKELEIAKKVQNFLFPKTLPRTDKLQIEAIYMPHHDVGGDYYDYIELGPDEFMVCVADVSGKGVPAALLMSNFQAALRTLLRTGKNLKEIIHELNHATFKSSNGENFITLFIGIFNFKTKKLEYANCGHNAVLLIQGKEVKELTEGTTVLGMFDPLPFIECQEVNNLEDFLLFQYTDGLTETFDSAEQQFGYDRLVNFLKSNHEMNLVTLHQQLFKEIDDFRGDESFRDDITMVSCRVKL
jgi:sigma-B regulation protein RsbU (phosphoserine phosphatase)